MPIFVRASRRAKAHFRGRSTIARDIKIFRLIDKLDNKRFSKIGLSKIQAKRYNNLWDIRMENLSVLQDKQVIRSKQIGSSYKRKSLKY